MIAGQFLKRIAGVLIPLLLLISCGVSKNIYFERYTDSPVYYLDSLSNEYRLDIKDYITWDKSIFYGNDSVATYIYTETFKDNDSLYILSVTEKENKDSVLLRFRKEVK